MLIIVLLVFGAASAPGSQVGHIANLTFQECAVHDQGAQLAVLKNKPCATAQAV